MVLFENMIIRMHLENIQFEFPFLANFKFIPVIALLH